MDGETFGEEVITIDLPKVKPQTGDTYMLEFSVQNKVKPDWDATLTKYDNVVAHEQFDLTPEYKETKYWITMTCLSLPKQKMTVIQ